MTIWTTSTVTVTTNPVRAAIAPTIADSTVLAVEDEYCHCEGTCAPRSMCTMTRAPTRPTSAPSSGRVQMLSARYWRTRNLVAHVTSSPAGGRGLHATGRDAYPCTGLVPPKYRGPGLAVLAQLRS